MDIKTHFIDWLSRYSRGMYFVGHNQSHFTYHETKILVDGQRRAEILFCCREQQKRNTSSDIKKI